MKRPNWTSIATWSLILAGYLWLFWDLVHTGDGRIR